MALSPRPTDLLAQAVQQIGLDVACEHDDLVFVSDNLFILKFTNSNHDIDLYFNEDIEKEKAQTLMALMDVAVEAKGMQVSYKGAFCMTTKEDNSIEVEFFDLADA